MRFGHDGIARTGRTWTRRAGRAVAAGALAFSMGCAPALVSSPAARADGTPGNVTINLPEASQKSGHTTNANDAAKVRYNAYRVFVGDVGLDKGAGGSKEVRENEIAEVAWASSAMRTAVVGCIERWDPSYEDPSNASESALRAAEFIANHIGSGGEPAKGAPNQDTGLRLESGQFGSLLVTAVRDGGAVECTPARDATVDLEPGKTYSFDDGWYLFVTSTGSVDATSDSRSGTSPIFAVVGGDDVVVTEKASVPTVDKQVKDDSRTGDGEDDWGMAADANAGQDVRYRIIGTVADNIHSYDSYYYKFTDVAGEGIVLNAKSGQGHENGDAEIYLHKAHDPSDKSAAVGDRSCNVTGNFKFTSSDNGRVLEAEAGNLRKLAVNGNAEAVYEMVAGDYLTMEYTGKLVPDGSSASETQGTSHGTNVEQGATGNRNEAKVTYSNNPKTSSKGTSYGQDTRVYTYSLRLHKQDKQNAARSLHGAKFTLQVENGDDAASKGKYVQADGSLGDAPHEFVTDGGGNILVKNLDAGTYSLVETGAPPAEQASGNPLDAYELLDPATIVIGSNVHSDAGVDGEAYANGSIYKKETGLQVLEISSSATATSGFGHGSLIDATDSIDASGGLSGKGLHVTATSGVAAGEDASDGNVSVVVREAKETQMPLTGGAGIAAFAAIGGGVAAAGAAIGLRRRARKAGPHEG